MPGVAAAELIAGPRVACGRTLSDSLLTINRGRRSLLLFINRSNHDATTRRSAARHAEFDGVDDPGCHGATAWLRDRTSIQKVSEDLLNLNQGTLYPALLRLKQRGRISSKWGLSDNRRKATYYSLTRSGRQQLGSAAESWERMAAMIARLLGAEGV